MYPIAVSADDALRDLVVRGCWFWLVCLQVGGGNGGEGDWILRGWAGCLPWREGESCQRRDRVRKRIVGGQSKSGGSVSDMRRNGPLCRERRRCECGEFESCLGGTTAKLTERVVEHMG